MFIFFTVSLCIHLYLPSNSSFLFFASITFSEILICWFRPSWFQMLLWLLQCLCLMHVTCLPSGISFVIKSYKYPPFSWPGKQLVCSIMMIFCIGICCINFFGLLPFYIFMNMSSRMPLVFFSMKWYLLWNWPLNL